MNKKIREYFLTFFNPEPDKDPDYWKRDYITLGQFILGVLIFPIAIIVYVFYEIFNIKIR